MILFASKLALRAFDYRTKNVTMRTVPIVTFFHPFAASFFILSKSAQIILYSASASSFP